MDGHKLLLKINPVYIISLQTWILGFDIWYEFEFQTYTCVPSVHRNFTLGFLFIFFNEWLESHKKKIELQCSRLDQPAPNTSSKHRSFSYIACHLWNNLPLHVREAPNLKNVLSQLKKVKLSQDLWFVLWLGPKRRAKRKANDKYETKRQKTGNFDAKLGMRPPNKEEKKSQMIWKTIPRHYSKLLSHF